ncbi:asparagine synthase-related protein [Lederbergia wuyishanensis]|uniref:asparagine synthase (glutamine-hydrolyzing) n=1 Tax=Lederbergia wuyishanensis TaxID=1347903 RepID=A0ABU0D7V0_9BACI|nr:asparagine synthase-related protein [Lederbergia wuyishanensis]MCJ8009107.1 asparagine synthase-related protein [Lederbergia wuyishanensis]MDQ0344445.1 asparagine synthase (glutamine-hydrolyzing) [Lederbergia wuyishanensis]
MSAIAGIFQFNNDQSHPYSGESLMKSFDQFPSNQKGTWKNDKIFLSCHVQWITPESVNETLPFYESESQLVITSDAIIDNRDELFDRLQIHHSQRKTMTDSELILESYLKWGEDCPKYLIGDFAFMIWDVRRQALFGARDFSGARTLYYYKDDSCFAFCTLIEPLFNLPFIKKQLNENWLAEFIVIPTIIENVDMHHTVYKDIYQLPPAHTILIKNSKVSLNRYWSLPEIKTLNLKSDDEYYEAFHEVFGKAVNEKIRTYGKVGSHLSGGLDSGSVVSFAAKSLKEENKELYTYSYIPHDNFIDWTPKHYIANEKPYIKETVNYVGNIKAHYLNFEDKNPFMDIDDFLEIMEMPYKFFENAYWLKGISEQASKDGVKIVLNGSRGNHSISWGSERLNYEYYASLLKRLKLLKLNLEMSRYCENFPTGRRKILPTIAKYAFPNLMALFEKSHESNYHFPNFINPTFAEKNNIYERTREGDIGITGSFKGDLNDYRRKYYDKLYVWNKSGTATTKLSLRNAVWDRDPTNDLRVIQFCLSLPEEQYAKDGMERSFLRRATKNILPDKVRLNHHIRGIQAADTIHRMKSSWGEFHKEIQELIKDSLLSEILDVNVIRNSLSNLGKEPIPELVWSDDFKILSRSLIIYRFLKRFN